MFETITVETDDRGVCVLTLNQPDKHNAMSGLMLEELTSAADQVSRDESIRVVVLTGAGKSFCAGGDLGWMKRQFEADRATRVLEAKKLAHMLKALNELPKPLIGKINGHAFGGGIGMMSVCDIAIGAETAKFALTETRLGLIPATISPYVLARMGEGKARQVFMSGKRFGAYKAVELDLLAAVAADSDLSDAIEAEITPYLECAPGAVAKAKRLARDLGSRIDDAVINDTANRLADCWEDSEALEGISAFLNKEKPSWQR